MSDIPEPPGPVLTGKDSSSAPVQPIGWRCFVSLECNPYVVVWGRNKPRQTGNWEPLYPAPPRDTSHAGAGEYLRSKAAQYNLDVTAEIRRLRGQPSAMTRQWDMLATAASRWAAELDERGRKRK